MKKYKKKLGRKEGKEGEDKGGNDRETRTEDV